MATFSHPEKSNNAAAKQGNETAAARLLPKVEKKMRGDETNPERRRAMFPPEQFFAA